MATNEFLPFANVDSGTNLLTQAEYAADGQRSAGNQPGIARAKLVNKAARQSSLMAAAMGKFIADRQGSNVVDTLTDDALATLFVQALRGGAVFTTPSPLDNSNLVATTAFVRAELLQLGNAIYNAIFQANKAVAGYQRLPSGIILQWGAFLSTSGSDLTTNLPITFPTASLAVFATGGYSPGTGVISYTSISLLSTSQVISRSNLAGQATNFLAIGY
jgi:hypothetical protein